MNNFLKFLKFSSIIFVFSLNFYNLNSQEQKEELKPFYMDAVVFRASADSSEAIGRIDVFFIIPYQSLDFIKSGSIYGASYEVTIKINDSTGKMVETKTVEKNLKEKDYFSSQGGNAKFEYSQTIFNLKPGKYEVEAVFTDKLSHKGGRKTRDITVVDFRKYNFSLSGMMFVSSIEERNNRFVITPHVSDNVGELKEGFFVFYETYSKNADSADIIYEVRDISDRVKFKSSRQRIKVSPPNIQHYIKITLPGELNQSNYKLRLIAMKLSSGEIKESDYIAISERTIKYYRTIGGIVLNDMEKAIKQLRYVAMDSEIDYIKASTTAEEKQRRFDDFWRSKDPSANTERNEAFEEYYTRIEFANKNFQSYADGWNTDKGMVYIIFGKPYNIEKSNPYGDMRTYERWTYGNNRQFVFVDNSGFGDFRLYQPMTVTEKYKYEK